MILFFSDLPKQRKTILKGQVRVVTTHAPVQAALVYIVKGEEEVFTDKNGNFLLYTWQEMPISLSVSREGFKEKQIRLESVPDKIEIDMDRQ